MPPAHTKTTIRHNVESTGVQRAIEIAAVIDRLKSERKAAGAKNVSIVFGSEQGTLLILEW